MVAWSLRSRSPSNTVKPIQLVTTSNGQGVDLTGCNLRLIVKGGAVEIHYATEKTAGRPCGKAEIGVDKGYTEVFTDSDGVHHGQRSGGSNRQGEEPPARPEKGAQRGRPDRQGRPHPTQQRLRTIADQAAHSVVDKAAAVASEDLTLPIKGKAQWRKYNRRMSGWASRGFSWAAKAASTKCG